MNVRKINLSDSAINLWQYHNDSAPFNINMIGRSDCRAMSDTGYYVKRTNSSVIALEYVIEGSGYFFINGKSYKPCKGSVMFLPKGSDHCYFPDKDDLWVKEWIVIDGKLAEYMMQLYMPEETYCLNDCDMGYFFEGLRNLLRSCGDNHAAFIDRATVMFCEAMIGLSRYCGEKINPVALQVKTMLDNNLENNLKLEYIAANLHYSVNYVIRVFKSAYGMSPHRYYLERKLYLAQLYLRNTDDSIGEISDRLRFADQHYFSNVFKQYSGMSASMYRDKFRNI